MPLVFARDHALDDALEAEARLILILVLIGVGILLLVTAIIIHGSQLWRKIRGVSHCPGQIANQTDVEKGQPPNPTPPNDPATPSYNLTDVEKGESTNPTSANDPATPMPQINPSSQPRREPIGAQEQRHPTPFIPVRSSSTPHRPTGVYNGVSRTPFTPTRPPPADRAPRKVQQQTKNTPAVPQGIVTDHIAEWNRVADSVVGRHPNAQPLCTRVATQAEIDLISGHVHIPWAFTGKPKSQPMPVKVLKPVAVPTPAPVRRLVKDISTIRGGRDVLVTVNNTAKRSPKRKSLRPVHGKENMPPAPLPLAHSGGRI